MDRPNFFYILLGSNHSHHLRDILLRDIIAVLAFSSAPLILGLSNGGSNPVLASVLMMIGQLTMFLFLLILHLNRYNKHIIRVIISFLRLNWHKHGYYYSRSKNLLNKEGLDLGLFKNIWNNYAFIGVISAGFFWLMFAWSIKFLDIAIAPIIVGFYLIFGIILLNLDIYYPRDKIDRYWSNLIGSTWGILILFMVGIIVTLSHANINLASDYRGLFILIVCITSGVVGLERSSKWSMEMNIKWHRMHDNIKLHRPNKDEGEDTTFQTPESVFKFQTPESMSKILQEEASARFDLLAPGRPTAPESMFKILRGDRAVHTLLPIFGLLGIVIGLILSLILITLGGVFWIFQGNTLDLSFASNSIDLFTNKIVITNTIARIISIIGGFITAIEMWNFSYSGFTQIVSRSFYLPDQVFKDSRRPADSTEKNAAYNYRLFIYCLTPVLSLVWLFLFSLVQLQSRDYLLLGTLIILATSILIPLTVSTFYNEPRTMLKWLIISLCSIGILIYFREKWIQWPWLADDTPWEWSIGSVDYYSLIVLTATIFILILSFRYNRLVARTNSEEDQYHRILTMIDKLSISLCNTAKANLLDEIRFMNVYYGRSPEVVEGPPIEGPPITTYLTLLKQELYKIDKNQLTQSDYEMLIADLQSSIRWKASKEINRINIIERAAKWSWRESWALDASQEILIAEGLGKEKLSDLEIKDLEKLSDLKLEFDLLYRSKQRGKYVAENLVLCIFSLITVFITISTRPAVISHWNALIIDLIAFLFSTAVWFMTMNLADLKLYREKPTRTLKRAESYNRGWLGRSVQVISIILAVVISISFVVLLYDKWMGIWFL